MYIKKDDIHWLCNKMKTAGKAVIEIYDTFEEGEVDYKADDSPLTEADKVAHQQLMVALEERFPDDMILSEEGKDMPYEQRKNASRLWVVDPLDGTKEFVNRNGDFTLNVALIVDHRAVFGMVHVPVTGETFAGGEGWGAYEYAPEEEVFYPIRVRSFNGHQKGLNILTSRSHLNAATEEYVDRFSNPNLVARGSAWKFLLIARGKADIYPRLAPTMEWDTAAAQIILEEAGGQVLRADDNEPLVYNKKDLVNPSFIAVARTDRPDLLEV